MGLARKDIHSETVNTSEDEASALSTVQRLAAEIKRKRKNLEDDTMSERPVSPANEENVVRLCYMVMNDR